MDAQLFDKYKPILLQQVKQYYNAFELSDEILKNKKVLDVGCGTGEFIKYLHDTNTTTQAYGLDISTNNLILGKKYFFHQDYNQDFRKHGFDLILFKDVFNSKTLLTADYTLQKFIKNLSLEGEIRVIIKKTGIYYPL